MDKAADQRQENVTQIESADNPLEPGWTEREPDESSGLYIYLTRSRALYEKNAAVRG